MSPACHYFPVNRTDRLYAVREELRRAGPRGRSAEQLAATFEVSVRTVKRDISALQHSGFPVVARPGPGGGYVVDAAATLAPVNFTDAEVSGLAAAVAAHHGQPFEGHARAALAKALAVMDARGRERAADLTKRIWIDHDDTSADVRVRRAVERALHERRVVIVGTEDTEGPPLRLDPVLLARTRGHWYFVGHHRDPAGIRWIRLDRVRTARLTTEPARDVPVAAVGTPPVSARDVAST